MSDNKPHTINENTRWYHDKRGILVVHEARTKSDAYIQTDQFIIPWRSLKAALNAKDKT